MGQQSQPFLSSLGGGVNLDQTQNNLRINNGTYDTVILGQQKADGTFKLVFSNGTFNFLTMGQNKDGTYSLLFNNGSNNTMLVGQDNTNNYVVKIAKPGFDAATATSTNLLFNSQQNTFNILAKPTLTLSFTRTSSTFQSYKATYAHGLGYLPAFVANLSMDPNLATLAPSPNVATPFAITQYVGGVYSTIGNAYISVDTINVTFSIDLTTINTGTYTSLAKVYLLQETLP